MWLINKTTSPITIDSYNLTIPGRSQVDIGSFAIDSKYLAGLEYAESASTDKTLKTCISEIDSEPAKLDITMLDNKAPGAIRDLVRLNNGDLLALSNNLCDYYRSTDNGNTWSKEQITISGSTVEIHALHLRYINDVLFITVDAGSTYYKKVLKSTDNGHTWGLQSVAEGATNILQFTVSDIMRHPDGHWAVAGMDYAGDRAAYCITSRSLEGATCVAYRSEMAYGHTEHTLVTVAGVYTALITSDYIEVINNTTGEKFTSMQHVAKGYNFIPYTFSANGNYFFTSNSLRASGYVITQYTGSESSAVPPATKFNLQGESGADIYPFGLFTQTDGKLLWYGRSSNYNDLLNFTLTDKVTIKKIGSTTFVNAIATIDTAVGISGGSVDTAVGYIDTAGKPIVIFGDTRKNESKAATAAFVPEKVNSVEVYPNISLAMGARILLQWETEYGDIRDEIIEFSSDYPTIQDEIHSYTGKYAKRIISVRILSAEL